MPDLTAEQREDSWHLVSPAGNDLTGGEGLIALLETVRSTRPLGRLCRRLRLAGFLGFINRVLKRTRGWMGRLVPDVEAPSRYP